VYNAVNQNPPQFLAPIFHCGGMPTWGRRRVPGISNSRTVFGYLSTLDLDAEKQSLLATLAAARSK
jgi:hypothetical protein